MSEGKNTVWGYKFTYKNKQRETVEQAGTYTSSDGAFNEKLVLSKIKDKLRNVDSGFDENSVRVGSKWIDFKRTREW